MIYSFTATSGFPWPDTYWVEKGNEGFGVKLSNLAIINIIMLKMRLNKKPGYKKTMLCLFMTNVKCHVTSACSETFNLSALNNSAG